MTEAATNYSFEFCERCARKNTCYPGPSAVHTECYESDGHDFKPMTEAANIPERHRKRLAHLLSYKPLELAVTEINVSEWITLIEELEKAEAECKALREQVERLKAPVGDEEFMEATGSTEVYDDELLTREAVSALIASRAEEKHG